MTDSKPIWQHPVIFFTTRLLILLGMMLVFGGMGYSIALFTTQSLFGVNFLENPGLMNQFDKPEVVYALKYVQGISAIGIFIFPAWYFCKALHREPADYLKLNRRIAFPEAFIAIAIMVVVSPFINWLVYINEKIKLPASMAELEGQLKQAENLAAQITKAFLDVSTINGLAGNIIVIAVIAAVGEEFLFRGAIQNLLRNVTGKKHLAVIITAIAFSAFHGQFYGFIPRLVLGAVLGYAYLFTGNLWISILMHFTNNALAVIFSYKPLAGQMPAQLQADYVVEEWYINAGSAVAALGLLLLLRSITQKRVWYNGE
jgi:uncharacterized protein